MYSQPTKGHSTPLTLRPLYPSPPNLRREAKVPYVNRRENPIDSKQQSLGDDAQVDIIPLADCCLSVYSHCQLLVTLVLNAFAGGSRMFHRCARTESTRRRTGNGRPGRPCLTARKVLHKIFPSVPPVLARSVATLVVEVVLVMMVV